MFCWLGWNEPEEQQAAELDLGAVTEPRPRPRHRKAEPAQRGPSNALPGELPERDHGAQVRQHQRQLRVGPGAQVSRSAGVGAFAGGAQRTAASIRVRIRRWPSSAARARRLRGQPRAIQRGEQPVAAAVAGEDAPRAVAAVGRRCQTHDQHPRRGHRPSRGSAGPSSGSSANERRFSTATSLAPRHQPRAGPAHRHPAASRSAASATTRAADSVRRGRARGRARRPRGSPRPARHTGAAGPPGTRSPAGGCVEQLEWCAARPLVECSFVVDLGPLVVEEGVRASPGSRRARPRRRPSRCRLGGLDAVGAATCRPPRSSAPSRPCPA